MAEEVLNQDDFRNYLIAFMDKENKTMDEIARAINCPRASIERIVMGKSFPSDEMIKQGAILMDIGYEKFVKLSASEKEKISGKIGAIGGAGLGFASVTAAVGASGSVVGLSAAGVTSGLAALGGGAMATGLLTVAAIPVAAGAVGYGLVKFVKWIFTEDDIEQKDFSSKWEKILEN